jgi:hypothetical protein
MQLVRYAWNTHIFLKNMVQTMRRCASARQNSLMHKFARWMSAPANALLQATRVVEGGQ